MAKWWHSMFFLFFFYFHWKVDVLTRSRIADLSKHNDRNSNQMKRDLTCKLKRQIKKNATLAEKKAKINSAPPFLKHNF